MEALIYVHYQKCISLHWAVQRQKCPHRHYCPCDLHIRLHRTFHPASGRKCPVLRAGQQAQSVQDFYYTLTAYFNGSDDFSPVSDEAEVAAICDERYELVKLSNTKSKK